jgi:hypothetical protein
LHPGGTQPSWRTWHMLKILLWIVGIIFLVGLLVVSGVLSMIF